MKQLDLNYYEQLPDNMDASVLSAEFKTLLTLNYSDFEDREEDLMEAWKHLAERQFHTWTLINQNLKKEINQWFLTQWNTEIVFLHALESIIPSLGLEKIRQHLMQLDLSKLNPIAETIVTDILEELDQDISDPYADYNLE